MGPDKAIRKAGGAVRDGVTLEVFNYEVRATDFPATLSYDSKDDRIVHSVKKYQEQNPDARVAVYTEDMGMSLRCEANGVEIVEPDTEKRLENPQDEQTKKYRRAMNELNDAKNRIPVLELVACDSGLSAPEKRPPEFEVTGSVPVRDLDAELAAYQQAKKLSPMAKQEIHGAAAIPALPQQHDAIELYNRELADHLKEYKGWLKHSHFIDQVEAHRIEFSLWLNNIGAAPADDIDLTVEVGDSVVILYEAEDGGSTPDWRWQCVTAHFERRQGPRPNPGRCRLSVHGRDILLRARSGSACSTPVLRRPRAVPAKVFHGSNFVLPRQAADSGWWTPTGNPFVMCPQCPSNAPQCPTKE